MKILWIVPKWTLPITDGARVATDSLIRNTVIAGAQVDYLCVCPKDEMGDPEILKKQWGIRNVHSVNRENPVGLKKIQFYLKKLILSPHIPLTFASYLEPSVVREVLAVSKKDNYDYILLDCLHPGSFFLNATLPEDVKLIYRAHNIETDLWTKASKDTPNILLKLLLLYQSRLVNRIEEKIIQKASLIASIASEDEKIIQQIYASAKTKLVPLGLDFRNTLPSASHGPIRFLFMGKLDWAPNRDALTWLLNEIWPEVIKRRPSAILKIVGSGDRQWLEAFRNIPGLEIVGFVKNISDAYKDIHFAVVPMRYGSGTRIKVIESFVMNRRLISTNMGVQGANLRSGDFELAETKEDWISVLSGIELNEELDQKVKESREYVASHLCERKIGNDFYQWLSTV